MNTLPDDLYHVHESALPQGSIIQPGRWGTLVVAGGKNHPFFFREHLLDIWRREKTHVQVSRLACTFAFESKSEAREYASEEECIIRVQPTNAEAPRARLDMLWLTWMSEPGATTDKVACWCAGYWSGRPTTDLKPTARTMWEWLFASPLRVL